ncbi:unnamed protein product [Protopolystoma xenopodis]|uniref:Uncharacterized protein n=1 Tax=Protopolystoma xenopodis TaxID=117903 RepID=A0A448X173_9PLAT|nr:unnamed protein product [Protopolystoma xenopodis]
MVRRICSRLSSSLGPSVKPTLHLLVCPSTRQSTVNSGRTKSGHSVRLSVHPSVYPAEEDRTVYASTRLSKQINRLFIFYPITGRNCLTSPSCVAWKPATSRCSQVKPAPGGLDSVAVGLAGRWEVTRCRRVARLGARLAGVCCLSTWTSASDGLTWRLEGIRLFPIKCSRRNPTNCGYMLRMCRFR